MKVNIIKTNNIKFPINNGQIKSFKGISDIFDINKETKTMKNILLEMENAIKNNIHSGNNFKYPTSYKNRILQRKLSEGCWEFLTGQTFILQEIKSLEAYHKINNLIPFAYNEDDKTTAYFLIPDDPDDEPNVIVLNSSTPTEYLAPEIYENYEEWMDGIQCN